MNARCAAALLGLCAALLTTTPELRAQRPELARQVEIRRTTYGVPHIRAENLRAAGYALAYAQLEDYGSVVVQGLLRNRGELSRHFGRDSLETDFRMRPRWLYAVERYPLLDADTREVYEGFAAGVNRYIELHPGEFPDAVRPDFTGPDVLTTDIDWPDARVSRGLLRRLGAPPAADAEGAEPPPHPDEGSNSWALAPSRTTSGKAILLRNPHLNWSAGYYEAHVTVPGVLDFYGDFRVGGPFRTIGGFNDRLGFSTTNNSVDSDEVYALEADPERPDHYRFDGASIPLRRTPIRIEFRNGAAMGTETRETLSSHLGPVVHQADGKIYVRKVAGADEFRLGTQWLRMMRARNLEEWKSAMRMLAKPSSNFTYADADGNIFYVSYGQVPHLPHPSGGDTAAVPAASSAEVWTRLVPFDSLPQLQNPKGGYIHQENDPFHYTNLNEVLLPGRFADNFPRPRLGLRSQHALQLVHGTGKMSLEDVVRLKHSMRMLLADRLKPELVASVRAGERSAAVDSAIALVERWDNTVAAESRGGVLFEAWWDRYSRTAEVPEGGSRAAALWKETWSEEAPTTTPRGLADPRRAADAFAWAVEETARRHGRWDVAWGEVHRVRVGGVDAPVGGCSGTLGCFRVLWFGRDDDGRLRATGGDGWVLAVEFTNPPRAYSVLAYGQSSKPGSPHLDDQAAMFAANRMKRVAFTEADIERQTIRRYHPGLEPTAGTGQ